MENLGDMAYSRYTGFREITDRDVLELHYLLMPCGAKKIRSFRHNNLTQTQIININYLFIKLKTSIRKLFLSFYKYIFLC